MSGLGLRRAVLLVKAEPELGRRPQCPAGPCSEAQGAPPSSLEAGLTHAPSAVRGGVGGRLPPGTALLPAGSSDTGCPMETA